MNDSLRPNSGSVHRTAETSSERALRRRSGSNNSNDGVVVSDQSPLSGSVPFVSLPDLTYFEVEALSEAKTNELMEMKQVGNYMGTTLVMPLLTLVIYGGERL